MRICADGYLDLNTTLRVVMPGDHRTEVEPLPLREAMDFLLSHTFKGHRKINRRMTETHRSRLRLAMWADSVGNRMAMVDRVWREITEPIHTTHDPSEPRMIQLVQVGTDWQYSLYLVGEETRVIPPGGQANWATFMPKDVDVFHMGPGEAD